MNNPTQPVTFLLDPEDNQRLADLCGEHNVQYTFNMVKGSEIKISPRLLEIFEAERLTRSRGTSRNDLVLSERDEFRGRVVPEPEPAVGFRAVPVSYTHLTLPTKA